MKNFGVVSMARTCRYHPKTDKLDAQLLANLLRINQIPLAYVPPKRYQQLRELCRLRAKLRRQQTKIKTQLQALLIIGELGEPHRFRSAKQVGAYTGLTSRVHQSGGHCYHGRITRQGSPWLRWILVEAAMEIVKEDVPLRNFYQRIRKRSSAKIARVAVARKLAEICWKRLRYWQGVPVSG